MQSYIRTVLDLVDRLQGIGGDIPDFHAAALLLSGLLDSYETLVTALDARPENELTLEYVKGKLVDKYKRKTESASDCKTEANKSVTALNVNSKGKGKFNKQASVSQSYKEHECFYCKKRDI